MKDIGAKAEDVSAAEMQALRDQVLNSLKSGKTIDPAALLRQKDFKDLGVEPTLGQVTRDATQFAKERNLRAAPGIGEPLLNRFETQNQKLQSLVAALRGDPSEPYQAGKTISGALSQTDDAMKSQVNSAYTAARDNLGRAAPMDAHAFSTKANLALDEGMLGHYLPAETRGILNDISSGKIPFNVNTAVQIDQTLSAAQRSAGQGTPQALAIGKVRDALNTAPTESSIGDDAKAAFDAARGMAKQRFALHDAIPALKAAADGEQPDKFVQKFVLGGNVEEVQRLAEMLRKTDPSAFQEARSQIGERVARAAFGENQAGDKLPGPERLAAALRTIGTDKLKAFYSDAEIAELKKISRVSAYINSTPSAAPVMGNPNGAWAYNLLGKAAGMVPGGGVVNAGAALVKALRNAGSQQSTVNAAMAAEIPETAAKLNPAQAQALARALAGGAAGIGTGLAIR